MDVIRLVQAQVTLFLRQVRNAVTPLALVNDLRVWTRLK